MIASTDPTNITLACAWSVVTLGAFVLTWYAYFRWKIEPNDSLSHKIAIWAHRQGMLVGFVLGLWIGLLIGIVLGVFTGHFFWAVELKAEAVTADTLNLPAPPWVEIPRDK
jgi:hypothetical protein